MTDQDLLLKKLSFIETCLTQLRTLTTPNLIDTDVKERRFVEHTLQVALQALLDAASHIVSDERLGEPSTNGELFDLLSHAGWLEPKLATTLRAAVGFRNVLVHGYTEVNLDVVRDVLENRLDDLEAFVTTIRQRLTNA